MRNRTGTILLATAMLLWSAGTWASIENLENAYESDGERTLLPSSSGGQVIIRECSSCTPVVLRVNPDTRYFIGAPNPPVSLEQLRTAAAAAPNRMLTVFYSLESGVVTRIVLSAG